MDKMDQNSAKRTDRPVLLGVGRGLLPRKAESEHRPAPAAPGIS